jgi:F0F1-type ATP synthase epsilon subunit
MLAGLLMAVVQLARVFGHEIPIDNDTALVIAGGIIAIFNTVFTITTSKHIGLPSTSVREAKQTLRSVEQPAAEESSQVQAESAPAVERGSDVSTIDDDVRARAIEWARRHSAINGLSNDA